jgi:hypothetical protein
MIKDIAPARWLIASPDAKGGESLNSVRGDTTDAEVG